VQADPTSVSAIPHPDVVHCLASREILLVLLPVELNLDALFITDDTVGVLATDLFSSLAQFAENAVYHLVPVPVQLKTVSRFLLSPNTTPSWDYRLAQPVDLSLL
jgi:hypothetical protein